MLAVATSMVLVTSFKGPIVFQVLWVLVAIDNIMSCKLVTSDDALIWEYKVLSLQ